MTPTDQPVPPPMQSPYGMPLPDGSGGTGDSYGFGDDRGPDRPGAGAGRRRKTLIASALAIVAVVGIGGAVAVMSGGSSKHDSGSAAGSQTSTTASDTDSGPGDDSAIPATGGKPNGDTLPGGGAVASSDIPGGPGATSAQQAAHAPGSTPGAPAGKSTGGTKPGNPVTTGAPAPAPATSKPGTTAPAPKPSTPAGTKSTAAPRPSTDCTYLDLPPQQMPTIKQGSSNSNAVKQAQCLLKKSMLGIKPLAIDGVWGSDTQSAMKSFQSCNNSPTVKSPGGTPPYPKLSVDGVAGTQTWADLYFWDNQYFNGVAYYCNGTR
ncbi:MAG: hypothetical protein AUG49_06080 [Catenulispora sp. 13_1_20CM_3_70_7]|nr:MAG: hypothetical protein AUG49_06080 [Catenulispora sp. 13_1_20CM_3_70_7]